MTHLLISNPWGDTACWTWLVLPQIHNRHGFLMVFRSKMRVRAQVRAHLVVFLVLYWLFSLILCVAHALGQMKMYVSLRYHISFMVMMFPFSQVMNWMKIPESTFLFLLFLSQCNSLSIPALYHTPFLLCCRIILSFSLSSIFGLVLFRSALSSILRSSFSMMVLRFLYASWKLSRPAWM